MTEVAALADTVIKALIMVIPPLVKSVKKHTVDGRAKKAQVLVDKSRDIMKEYWDQLTYEERVDLRRYLDAYVVLFCGSS
jgi:hypothetical protein